MSDRKNAFACMSVCVECVYMCMAPELAYRHTDR